MSRRVLLASLIPAALAWTNARAATDYLVVDTGQAQCYDTVTVIPPPASTGPFYGQDAQNLGAAPNYLDNGDGTVTDLVTGLTWQQDVVRDVTWDEFVSGNLADGLGGHHDWRAPTIKELYSLIRFDGWGGVNSSDSSPFIDLDYFNFAYGDSTENQPRFIDVQEWSSTSYVGIAMTGQPTAFGVNFADGRIKGYPKVRPDATVERKVGRYVRGAPYGVNALVDNGDGTISDRASGLMWSKQDSGAGMNWEDALAWVHDQNDAGYLGHSDWRLPNAKELQSIVDYSRAPNAPGPQNGPAIDPIFQITQLADLEYPYFWASTTHGDGPADSRWKKAVYVAFGRALGWVPLPPDSTWTLLDVHGAGAQRSDPKYGDPAAAIYDHGSGPQGDVVRINNFVRLVRTDGATTGVEWPGQGPGDAGLSLAAAPVPARGPITIEFTVAKEGPVWLRVFDVRGRLVRSLLDGRRAAGTSRVTWDGRNREGAPVAAGTYFVRLDGLSGGRTLRVPVLR